MSGHHISSAKFLWGIGFALFVLTFITVAVTWMHIPGPWNVVVAIGLAAIKATIVAAFFMNLYWDSKYVACDVIRILFSYDWHYAAGHAIPK